MSREIGDVVLLVLGVTVVRVVYAGGHTAYVKPSWGPYLAAAGVAVVLLAIADLVGQLRSPRAEAATTGSSLEPVPEAAAGAAPADGHDHDGGHDHSHVPGVAALLVLPVLVLYVVAPPPLGAWAAAREPARAEVVSAGIPPLEVGQDGVADTDLLDVVQRMWSAPETVADVPVRVLGFVTPGEETPAALARITVSCCAADGRPVKLDLTGPGAASLPPEGEWVEVEGRWTAGMEDPVDGLSPPVTVLEVSSVTPAQEPEEPYLL